MYLDKRYTVLTVGDGDLSFSSALIEHSLVHSVTASVLDSEATLLSKYKHNALPKLRANSTNVYFQFDVTNESAWQTRIAPQYDLVIFQFPLVPAVNDKSLYQQGPSMNIRNRIMLRQFLRFASQYALNKDGEGLVYITSKDVKPYIDWNIERLAIGDKTIHFLGRSKFDANRYEGYRLRNVDRDKTIKDTAASTYVWSTNRAHWQCNKLTVEPSLLDNGCVLCKAGPFTTESEKVNHQSSARHKRMVRFEQEWQTYLEQEAFKSRAL